MHLHQHAPRRRQKSDLGVPFPATPPGKPTSRTREPRDRADYGLLRTIIEEGYISILCGAVVTRYSLAGKAIR